jgi:hypothetical protein
MDLQIESAAAGQTAPCVSLDRLLEAASTEPLPPRPAPIHGVVIGRLVGIDERGAPLVQSPANPAARPQPARATIVVAADHIHREVALLFEGGDPGKPLIMGFLEHPVAPAPREVQIDNQRLELTADQEIVLRCGKASITLTRAGKVLIRGAYLLSRSSGVNRIKGGSVQIN